MKRFRYRKHADTVVTEINLSPLIDMVFILLIFFMVTSVFIKDAGVRVNKPEAVSAEDLEDKSVLFAIDSQGRFYHGGREIDIATVQPTIRRAVMNDATVPVVIQADRDVPTGVTMRLIDEAKLAGAASINLAAEPSR